MTQPDLFAAVKPYVNGRSAVARACSQAGARHVQPKAGTQAALILACLHLEPLTLHELAGATFLPLATVCARVGWLRQQGLIRASGHTRPGPTGVPNTVWIAVER